MGNTGGGSKREPVPNSVLAALPRPAYAALRSGLEEVQLKFGEILYEPGDAVRHVYFPSKSLVSLLTLVDRHSALEVGMVGREGMVGMSLTLGSSVSPVRALVQGAGKALRMNATRFRREFKRSPLLQRGLFTYLNALMAQITQTAACNRFHRIDGRLARWLLMTSDRVRSDRFELTQDFLSHMLGVRRVGVTEAASALQKQKLIEYARGRITILNHAGLEAASCPCYALVRDMNEGKQKALNPA
jgi:CRP-like cAMP-binding protein